MGLSVFCPCTCCVEACCGVFQKCFSSFSDLVRVDMRYFGPKCLLFLNCCRRCFTAYVVFPFFLFFSGQCPSTLPHPKPQVSGLSNKQVPPQESLCICVTASQSLRGAQKYLKPKMFQQRHQLEVCVKGLLKSSKHIRRVQADDKFNGSSRPIELERFVPTLRWYSTVRRRLLHT